MDLPGWQERRAQLHPKGLEIVTVALDTGGPEAARSWVEAAKPEHPSLIDEAHVLDELLGIVNVPNAVWINEDGVLVRPAEPAQPGTGRTFDLDKLELPKDLPPVFAETLAEAKKIRTQPAKYAAAVDDWVEHGAASRYALGPDEVVARSGERGRDRATAAAHFELAQHLWRAGDHDAAWPHFRAARRLQPENWTYKRQAWQFADPFQQPTDRLEGSWLDDIKAIGAENYYPPLALG
jgi:hypothetical protein